MTVGLPVRADFPPGFMFGAATSAYQIEGSRFGGAGPSHWDTWALTPGTTANGETGAVACDHYHRFEEDFDLARGANLDAWRFSTSWARIQPDGRGAPNAEALDYYDRLVDAMLGRGLAPWLTLYHWELPAALADTGGWTNPDTAARFADFARLVMARIGDRVATVATFNEPWCVTWNGHFFGRHAPGMRDLRATARACHFVLSAHAQAVSALRAEGVGDIGIVINLDDVHPATAREEDLACAALYDAYFNQWFLGAIFHGRYPEAVLDGFGQHMPAGWEADLAAIAAPLDWLGVNYYTRKLIGAGETGLFPDVRDVPGPLPRTSMGWEVYPDGLHAVLTRVARDFAPGLPLYVTENGMSADEPDEAAAVEDMARIAFLAGHLDAALRAIADGVPLKGYFVWSMLDNFEWARGYAWRFGLVHTDFATLARTPKASYRALAAVLAERG